jgi:hypothetical protein
LIQLVLHNFYQLSSAPTTSDTTGTSPPGHPHPPKITARLIQILLKENGEMERANDPELIQRMMQVAGAYGGSGDDPDKAICLDATSLLAALTGDLHDWQVGIEDRQSTYVQDIFGVEMLSSFDRLGKEYHYHPGPKTKLAWATSGIQSVGRPKQQHHQSPMKDRTDTSTVSHKPTIPGIRILSTDSEIKAENIPSSNINTSENEVEDVVQLANRGSNGTTTIDRVVDQNASNLTMLLAWLTFIGYAGTWVPVLLDLAPVQITCDKDTFGCVLGDTILKWYVNTHCPCPGN